MSVEVGPMSAEEPKGATVNYRVNIDEKYNNPEGMKKLSAEILSQIKKQADGAVSAEEPRSGAVRTDASVGENLAELKISTVKETFNSKFLSMVVGVIAVTVLAETGVITGGVALPVIVGLVGSYQTYRVVTKG
jgi:hypothetical protein